MKPRRPHHADLVNETVAHGSAAKSALVASWRRSSVLHGLDPATRDLPNRLTEQELRQARDRVAPLIAAAQPSLDRLYAAVGGIGCCVLLADAEGVPVERRGAAADDTTFQEWGLWTGAIWTEDAEGTNGIGTCLVERRTLTIHRDQHFFSRNTALSCTTAPVYDHNGLLAGALDVSSCRADLTEGFLGLISMSVADAARQIETDGFRQAFAGARIVVAPGDRGGATLVAVDKDDLVVGATRAARHLLNITDESLGRPLPAADLLGDRAARPCDDLGASERAVLQRALARTGGNVSAAAAALGMSRATLHRKMKRVGLDRPN